MSLEMRYVSPAISREKADQGFLDCIESAPRAYIASCLEHYIKTCKGNYDGSPKKGDRVSNPKK